MCLCKAQIPHFFLVLGGKIGQREPRVLWYVPQTIARVRLAESARDSLHTKRRTYNDENTRGENHVKLSSDSGEVGESYASLTISFKHGFSHKSQQRSLDICTHISYLLTRAQANRHRHSTLTSVFVFSCFFIHEFNTRSICCVYNCEAELVFIYIPKNICVSG